MVGDPSLLRGLTTSALTFFALGARVHHARELTANHADLAVEVGLGIPVHSVDVNLVLDRDRGGQSLADKRLASVDVDVVVGLERVEHAEAARLVLDLALLVEQQPADLLVCRALATEQLAFSATSALAAVVALSARAAVVGTRGRRHLAPATPRGPAGHAGCRPQSWPLSERVWRMSPRQRRGGVRCHRSPRAARCRRRSSPRLAAFARRVHGLSLLPVLERDAPQYVGLPPASDLIAVVPPCTRPASCRFTRGAARAAALRRGNDRPPVSVPARGVPMARDPHDSLERDRRDITALADGALSDRRRAAVEGIAASPELRETVDRQRRAIAALHAIEAPVGDRSRRDRGRAGRPEVPTPAAPQGRRRGCGRGGGGRGGDRARRRRRGANDRRGGRPPALPPTEPALEPRPDQPRLLATEAEGLAYPNWIGEFGWRPLASAPIASATATQRPSTTRRTATDRQTIVSGDSLGRPPDATTTTVEESSSRSPAIGERTIVTWPARRAQLRAPEEDVDGAPWSSSPGRGGRRCGRVLSAARQAAEIASRGLDPERAGSPPRPPPTGGAGNVRLA